MLSEALRGTALDTAVNVKSVSKSIVAALVGCALQRGVIDSVQVSLAECIPDLLPASADPRVGRLTLENLLTMQAGLQRTSGPYYGQWVTSANWVEHVLSRTFVAEPGARMLYSTGDWHVLGVVLSQLTGKSLHTLANDWIGEPLDFRFAPWTRDPQGHYMGGNQMSMSPLEMARFGELYRLDGRWQKRRVFSAPWADQSFTARTRSPWSGDEYGYGWFLRRHGGVRLAYARGYGGQFIHVVPDAELVVAMTSDTAQATAGGNYTEQLHKLVTENLLHTAG